MATVLAIDLGTGGPKVALVDRAGAVVAAAFAPVPVRLGAGGAAEQRPADWWAAVAAAARRVLAAPPDGALPVRAVAITGQWAGTVPVTASGDAAGDAVIWMDARGAPHVRRLLGGRVAVGGYRPRALARWLRVTGGAPSLSGRDALGHVLFLRAERPAVDAATACYLEPVDWLGLRLSGRAASAGPTMTLHWVTDTRDPARIRYAGELVAAAGLDPAKLPPLVAPNAILGPLTAAARDALGLPDGPPVPVVAGTPDTMSAAVGSGAVRDRCGHLYVGTSSWLSCHVARRRTDPLHSVAALPAALPGRYLVSCEQETAGASLERLRDVLLPGSGDDGYAELERLAAAAAPGAGGVIFTPWLNGERTPVDDELVRGGLHNLSLDTTREQIARAVFEGVALNARWMQGHVERLCGRRLDPLAFVGGGARSPLWGQIMADVLGRTVQRIADPVHANVSGAALLAWTALGGLTVESLHGRAAVAEVHEPRAARRRAYDELYAAFRRLYRTGRRARGRLAAVRPARRSPA